MSVCMKINLNGKILSVPYKTVHVAELGDESGDGSEDGRFQWDGNSDGMASQKPKWTRIEASLTQHLSDKQSNIHNSMFLSEITLPINNKLVQKHTD